MVVKAYVVLAPGHEGDADLAKALQDHVKATIAPYKYPRAVVFVDSLPKTPSGKLQRFALRRQAADVARPEGAIGGEGARPALSASL
jgi:2-aminobenzoate-CoA ligase